MKPLTMKDASGKYTSDAKKASSVTFAGSVWIVDEHHSGAFTTKIHVSNQTFGVTDSETREGIRPMHRTMDRAYLVNVVIPQLSPNTDESAGADAEE